MERKVKLAPSIIAIDYKDERKLNDALSILKDCGVELLHLDIMDGKFVPEVNLDIEFVSKMHKQTDHILDVHLMVENPELVVEDYIKAGADILTIHFEQTQNLSEVLKKIKSNGVLAGVAIKPETPVQVLEPFLKQDLVDLVMVMSVEPGACGRPFNNNALPKIEYLRRNYPKIDIAVDGGINLENANLVVQVGANILVSGSAIFNSNSPKKVIEELSKYRQVKF